MKVINPKNEGHRRDLEYMCSFMEADSIEYIDHDWWEEYLIKKGAKTLSLHACSNKPDGGFLTMGQNRWTIDDARAR